MTVKNMSKEELELLSNKDITNLLLEENGCQNTGDLFNQIIELLGLPKSTFDKKIGDYFTALTTDKRFILLEDGNWDLRSRHTIEKLAKIEDDDDDDDNDEISEDENENEEDDTNFDINSDEEESFDDDDDDLKDLVVLDEDELELEQ